MKSTFLAAALMAATLAITGCKSDGDDRGTRTEEIAAEKLPAAVSAGFAKAYPGTKIEEVEKETYADGTVHYEIEYVGSDGKEKSVELNAEGEVLEAH